MNYAASVSNLSFIVGEKIPWKISVVNLGMLDDNYTINITNDYPNKIIIDPLEMKTSTLSSNEVDSVFPTMLILLAQPYTLPVFVTSNNDPFSCTENANCTSLPGGICHPTLKKCGINIQIVIKSGLSSLPEFDFYGFLMIFIVAAIVFSLIVLKKRKFSK